jgi:hypothetical protein
VAFRREEKTTSRLPLIKQGLLWRSANLQDVPFSVSATNEAQIRDSGSENSVDLARNIAGFAIADLGPGQSQMAIRGISSGQVIRDQPGVKEQVGVYLDESPISVALFTPDLELFDIDRFEVLRGPQGMYRRPVVKASRRSCSPGPIRPGILVCLRRSLTRN